MEVMNELNSILKKHFSNFELSIYYRILIEKLNSKILESENQINTGLFLGTSKLAYSFPFNKERVERDLSPSLKIWKFAVVYFEEIAKEPQQKDIVLKFDELPDFLTISQVTELMGWTKSTISTKHSKGELACVEGTTLTPKQGLMDYLKKRIKGVPGDPEEWFSTQIIEKSKK